MIPRQQIREAFLAHRLNQAELVRVVGSGDQAEKALQDLLDPATDLRDPVDPPRLSEALEALGLDQEFAGLDPAKVWTPYERALFRRLSNPDFDPSELPAIRGQGSGEEAPGPLTADFVRTVDGRFDQWDRNQDTRLEVAEVDRAMEATDSTPAESAALVLLRSNPEALGSCQPHDGPGVTRADLGLLARQGFAGAPEATLSLGAEFRQLEAEAEALSPAAPLQAEDLDPLATRQNRLGSCVLLSTAAGLAPEQLEDLFETGPAGAIRVNFRDGEDETVFELTPAERLFHARGASGERWPGLLEVAMGQRLARQQRSSGSVRQAADGVPPQEAILALTGRETRMESLDELSLLATRDLVAELCSQPGPRICGTRPRPLLKEERAFDVETLHNGLQNSHCYTLLDYDPQSDTVGLRNPWGSGPWLMAAESAESGLFRMPLAQFYAGFRWVAAPQPQG